MDFGLQNQAKWPKFSWTGKENQKKTGPLLAFLFFLKKANVFFVKKNAMKNVFFKKKTRKKGPNSGTQGSFFPAKTCFFIRFRHFWIQWPLEFFKTDKFWRFFENFKKKREKNDQPKGTCVPIVGDDGLPWPFAMQTTEVWQEVIKCHLNVFLKDILAKNEGKKREKTATRVPKSAFVGLEFCVEIFPKIKKIGPLAGVFLFF